MRKQKIGAHASLRQRICKSCKTIFPYIPCRILCVDCYKRKQTGRNQEKKLNSLMMNKIYIYYIEMDKVKKNENHANPRQRNQRQNQEGKKKGSYDKFQTQLLEIII